MSNTAEKCSHCKDLEKENNELREKLREYQTDLIRLYGKLEELKSSGQSKGALVIAFRQKQFKT